MDPQREHGIYAEKHVKIICIGAGPSGLLLAYKLRKHFQNFSLTVCQKTYPVERNLQQTEQLLM
jgi:2-polyprenyl-6-methoxyphenol hydroxylase-like FAD-dependent oxidoreductase